MALIKMGYRVAIEEYNPDSDFDECVYVPTWNDLIEIKINEMKGS